MHHLFNDLSHFHMNRIVRACILAETILWSSWNLFTPIFAIFVLTDIKNGNIEAAASGFSMYLICRIIFELLSAKYLINKPERMKFQITVIGMLCLSIAYIGFSFTTTIFEMFFFYLIAGVGLGIATPAKSVLFAMHLDKNREAAEWSIGDAVVNIFIAGTTIIGSIIAKQFGFSALFLLAGLLNLIGTLPYIQFLPFGKKYIFNRYEE